MKLQQCKTDSDNRLRPLLTRTASSHYLSSIFLMVTVLLTGGCMQQQEADIPQEGDVVTWVQSSLIIKAKLGQRRAHVIAAPRIDHLIYEPQYELFIGQFPIDYEPEPFPKFTEEEQTAFLAEFNSKIHARKSLHYIEFNLMLNGVEAKATDVSPIGGDGMDDPNQVKVIIYGHGTQPITTKSGVKRAPYNTRQSFELELIKNLDVSAKITKDGVDCYPYKHGSGSKRCFGQSTHPSVSGFHFYIPANAKSNIYAISEEFIYGGIKVEWFTSQKNINRAKDIDAAIWRLLEAWNIAPIQNNDWVKGDATL